MSFDPGGTFVGQLLSNLEDRELPLLSWGVTTGALSKDEVLNVVETALGTHGDAPADLSGTQVVQYMIDAGLLFQVPDSFPVTYRTRMAEALRLLAQLRQLFLHRNIDFDTTVWWQQYRTLVADYRLHVANRRYPKRNVPLVEAIVEWAKYPNWDALAEKTVTAQVAGRELARFQVDGTSSVLAALRSGKDRGIVIGAGTGSGKTLAFYLPAFTAIRQWAAAGGRGQVHTLALYPRTELLRDQLRDALETVEALGVTSTTGEQRPLRVGVLYGDTPQSPEHLQKHLKTYYKAWISHGDGLICPFLSCPSCERGKLKWADRDRDRGIEALWCTSCRYKIKPGRLALTRQSMQSEPPDLLFTTTEMLNRNSADPEQGSLLGWMGRGPKLVLLDEVHTYSGTHGAQVALLLRRWRHSVRTPMTLVGLSATLREAGTFFADLIGLPGESVTHIEPRLEDMEEEGREYAIAVRSDPVSGTSVLSTSIQTAMLFGRVLEADGNKRSPFGSTGFLFTDDLDVSNRFYDDLRDAEGGQNRFGAAGRKPVLAGLRSSEYPQHEARYSDAQSWDLVERIGHVLGSVPGSTRPLPVARTTSQDTGVDSHASLIVATAALEVGFNDPRVGLVVQHKAPYDSAAFIQRRGRAGRERGTRPITVVVLSEYGRDRAAYQAYDSLFAPDIAARGLPISNRHVQKIQAAQSMFDWLAVDFRKRFPRSDIRKVLQPPKSAQDVEYNTQQWAWLTERLDALLTNSRVQDNLAQHLKRSLQIDDGSAQALLWEQPRSLFLSVVPTVLRRLESRWESIRADPGKSPNTYLPEFVTRALFEPLNLPEVEFDLPFAADRDEHMPISRALREAVPGRVSKRFGYQRDEHRTWLPVPPSDQTTLDIDVIAPHAPIVGRWQPWEHPTDGFRVLRPSRMKLGTPNSEIKDSSQGYPLWGTQFVVSPHGLPPADVPRTSPWSDHVISVAFATHASGNPAIVRRMTYGAQCDVATASGTERRTITYTHEGVPAALGFTLDVDGMRLEISPLDVTDDSVQTYMRSPQWRSTVFNRAVIEHPALLKSTNHFQRSWLALVYLISYALEGVESDATPRELWHKLSDGSWRRDLHRVLAVLYRNDSLTTSGQPKVTDRLLNDLTELSHNAAVVTALNDAGLLLHVDDVAARTSSLARRAYFDTVAAAVFDAALRACRNAGEQDLVVDVIPGPTEDHPATIWLTETGIGGIGVIEGLAEFYAADPTRFWSLVAGALRPGEFEITDAALTNLVQNLRDDPGGPIAQAMTKLRNAGSANESDLALRELRKLWTALDGPVNHAAVAALSIRLLRPGSSPQTDLAAAELISAWSTIEGRLGVEIDARVLAYAVGNGPLGSSGTGLSADQVFSLLWPRGAQVRNQHLNNYQPYISFDSPAVHDRLLVETAHDERLPLIPLDETDWTTRYRTELPRAGAVWLTCPIGERARLAAAIAWVPALSVDHDVLRVYGTVTETMRHHGEFRVRVELRESGR